MAKRKKYLNEKVYSFDGSHYPGFMTIGKNDSRELKHFKRVNNAHARCVMQSTKKLDFLSSDYHFKVRNKMIEKGRVLTRKEKKEIYDDNAYIHKINASWWC